MIGWTRRPWRGWRGSIAVAVSGEASQREGASRSDGNPGASWPGASPDRAGEYGAGTGEVVRRAAARLQRSQYESGESGRTEPGTANRTAAVAAGAGIAE